jgi:uncharacterized membrane protein HdeD (DUF308 family)
MNPPDRPILRQLATNLCDRWWVLLIRGIAAIAFGVLCFANTGLSLTTLVLMFGAYALVDGVFGIVAAVAGRKEIEDWWILLLWGLVGIAVGILTFANPEVTAIALVFYIGAWAIVSGVLQIVLAIRLRKEIEGELLLGLAGLLSIVVGGLLFARPGAGALAMVWVIGSYAIAFGLVLSILAFRVRGFGKKLQSL